VLLSNEKGDNILKKVCFPNDLSFKIGFVLNLNKSCSKKVIIYLVRFKAIMKLQKFNQIALNLHKK